MYKSHTWCRKTAQTKEHMAKESKAKSVKSENSLVRPPQEERSQEDSSAPVAYRW